MRRPILVSPSTHSLFAALRPVRVALCVTIFFAALCAEAQFQLQDSNTTASLRGISSPGNGVAWASGTGGTVLRTEDGGYVWQGCAMPPGAEKLDFRGVHAFDAQTALVMSSGKGDLSRVYKTTDGCRTWKLVFTNPDVDGFFDAIQTFSHGRTVVVGDPVGGMFPLFALPPSAAEAVERSGIPAIGAEAAFAASNASLLLANTTDSCLVTGGARSRFVCSHREGDSIGTGFAPLPFDASPTSGAFAVLRNPASTNMVVVGGDYSKPDKADQVAAWSSNGRSWKSSGLQPHGYRSSVAYDATTKTWITVGPNGTDVSRDDGRNWSPLLPGKDEAPDADKQWNALALPFVVGPHGRIGRLRDDAFKVAPSPKSIH